MNKHHKRRGHHGRRHHGGDRAWHHGHGAEPCRCGHSFRRRFATRDERIAHLEAYLGELRAEAKAVEERIAELKAVAIS